MVKLSYSHLDLVALAVFATCWFGYDWFARRHAASRPSLLTVMNPFRERWFEQTLTRENRIVDSALVANLMHSATFFSSTTILVLGGLLALFGSIEKSADLFENLPFAQRSSQQLLETKVVLLILLFIYALVKFTWSVRQFNFVTVIVGSIAPKETLSTADEGAAKRASGIVTLAGENFGQGLRAYYFALAVLLWFVQPLFFIVATGIVTLMLYRMEFHSRTLDVLSGNAE
ncbi:MAG: DUF599 family protein [Betaproteobacteria bacterium]|nr:MAG: DUF599 family protein [Betaproteobacteria bacterium]